MEGRIILSQKELQRAAVLEQVRLEQIRLCRASQIMNISYRQAKRLKKHYEAVGGGALVHGGRGKPSSFDNTSTAHGPSGSIDNKSPPLRLPHCVTPYDPGNPSTKELAQRLTKSTGSVSRQNQDPRQGYIFMLHLRGHIYTGATSNQKRSAIRRQAWPLLGVLEDSKVKATMEM